MGKLPSTKAFIDNFLLKSSSVAETQILLKHDNTALTWTRMALKSPKSKCLIVVNGKAPEHLTIATSFETKSGIFLLILGNLVKLSGRFISSYISDKEQSEFFSQLYLKNWS